jgi:hypothetical protein
MSKFFPDVSTDEGIEAATNWGAMAAIGFGFLQILSAVPGAYRLSDLIRYEVERSWILLTAAILTITVLIGCLGFFTAFRFMRRKGLVLGIILFLLLSLALLSALAMHNGTLWMYAWIMLSPPILYGLSFGIRGAIAARKAGALANTDLGDVFQ